MKSATLSLCVGGLTLALVTSALRAEAILSSAAAQDARRTISEGVYTREQAARGGQAYEQWCARCHSDDLSGGGDGEPALAGLDFMAQWHGQSVAELVTRITETEPYGAPGSLRGQEYVDVVSYILKMNRVPPGGSELPSSRGQLKQILMTDRPR